MASHNFKKWIRDLRRERREEKLAQRAWDLTHVNINSVRNNTRELPGTVDLGGGTDKYWSHDRLIRLKSPRTGDHVHSTLYNIVDYESVGVLTLAYRWFYDSGTVHQSGLRTYGPEIEGSVAWDGDAIGVALLSKLQTAAQLALNAKVANGFPSYDWLTDAVEARDSANLLISSARKIEEMAIGVFKRDPKRVFAALGIVPTRRKMRKMQSIMIDHWDVKSGKSVFNAMSDIWMNYRYGFMPMIYSMEDALKATFGASQSKEYWNRFQVTLADSVFSQNSQEYGYAFPGLKVTQTDSVSTAGSVRMKAFVRYSDGIKSRFLASPPIDLLNTAWEEVPFSFVIDWFYDIGGYFQQLRLEEIVGEVFVNVSEKGTRVSKKFFSGIEPLPDYRIAYVRPEWIQGYTCTSRKFFRSPGSLSAVPPSLEQGLYSWKRLLDSSSMAWQKTRRALDRDIEGRPIRSPFSNLS